MVTMWSYLRTYVHRSMVYILLFCPLSMCHDFMFLPCNHARLVKASFSHDHTILYRNAYWVAALTQAFGTIGAVEAAYFRETGKQLLLSEQDLMDCGWYKNNKACFGGYQVSCLLHLAIWASACYACLSAGVSAFSCLPFHLGVCLLCLPFCSSAAFWCLPLPGCLPFDACLLALVCCIKAGLVFNVPRLVILCSSIF